MSTITVRVGSANVKGGFSLLSAMRSRAGNSVDRMVLAARRACDDNGVTILGTQETSSLQVVEGNRRLLHFRVHAATPNDTRRNVGLGNAIWWRSDVWKLVERDELVVEVGKVASRYRIPTKLHFPVVVLKHRETGALIRVLCFHFPAGRTRSAQDAKRRCAQVVEAFAAMSDLPIVVVGDRNRADLLEGFSRREHVVDYVGSPNLTVTKRTVDLGNKGLISDHAGLYATVELPIPDPEPVICGQTFTCNLPGPHTGLHRG